MVAIGTNWVSLCFSPPTVCPGRLLGAYSCESSSPLLPLRRHTRPSPPVRPPRFPPAHSRSPADAATQTPPNPHSSVLSPSSHPHVPQACATCPSCSPHLVLTQAVDDDYRAESKAQALPSAALPLGWAPRLPAGLPSRPRGPLSWPSPGRPSAAGEAQVAGLGSQPVPEGCAREAEGREKMRRAVRSLQAPS